MSACMLLISFVLLSRTSFADDEKYTITLKNNIFEPSVLYVPANKKIKIKIINLDDEPEEFDSFDLNREKVLFPNRPAIIYIGPLTQGEYKYFGEFHPNLATGKIVASKGESQNAN
jgi:hypothetical protein